MDLQELKQCILEDNIPSEFMIFKYTADTSIFLIEQYLDKICKASDRSINSISSLSEINNSSLSLVFNFDLDLNILKVDKFSEFVEDYDLLSNTIVICKEIDKKLAGVVDNYIVKFPDLQEWQLVAYIQAICPGVSVESCANLVKYARTNPYRIKNEIDKLLLFDEADREAVICKSFESKGGDLYYFQDYEINDAIRDFKRTNIAAIDTLTRYFKHKDSHPLKGKNKSADTELLDFVGASIGGLSANKNYYATVGNIMRAKFYLPAEVYKLEFLTDIDLKIKSGELDLSNDTLLDYVILRLLSINSGLCNCDRL